MNQIEVVTLQCKHQYHIDCFKKQVKDISDDYNDEKLEKNLTCKTCQQKISFNLVETFLTQKFIQESRLEIENKKTYECPICFGERNIIQECTQLNCGHLHCNYCLQQFIENNIEEGKISSQYMKCSECDENQNDKYDIYGIYKLNEITPQIIKKFCSPQLYKNYQKLSFMKGGIIMCPGKLKKPNNQDEKPQILDILVQFQILNNNRPEGLETVDCTFIIGKEAAQNKNKKIFCPLCNVNFCASCLKQGHNGTCEEFQQEQKRLQEEQRKLEEEQKDRQQVNIRKLQEEAALKLYMDQNNIRYCANPKCQVLIQKIDGCNRVTCNSCKKSMCWKDKCMKLFETADLCYAHLQAVHGGYFDK